MRYAILYVIHSPPILIFQYFSSRGILVQLLNIFLKFQKEFFFQTFFFTALLLITCLSLSLNVKISHTCAIIGFYRIIMWALYCLLDQQNFGKPINFQLLLYRCRSVVSMAQSQFCMIVILVPVVFSLSGYKRLSLVFYSCPCYSTALISSLNLFYNSLYGIFDIVQRNFPIKQFPTIFFYDIN